MPVIQVQVFIELAGRPRAEDIETWIESELRASRVSTIQPRTVLARVRKTPEIRS